MDGGWRLDLSADSAAESVLDVFSIHHPLSTIHEKGFRSGKRYSTLLVMTLCRRKILSIRKFCMSSTVAVYSFQFFFRSRDSPPTPRPSFRGGVAFRPGWGETGWPLAGAGCVLSFFILIKIIFQQQRYRINYELNYPVGTGLDTIVGFLMMKKL